MAPPYSRNFSVRVVFPASGCEMIAKVLLRLISCSIEFAIASPLLCEADFLLSAV